VTSTVSVLTVWAPGRPAPQGSKKQGEHGQLRESSPYLPAWRAAVKRAVYERYRELGMDPASLPLFVGPVGVAIAWHVDWRPDTEPDGDKLERATWDALTQARVWEDDARVIAWSGSIIPAGERGMGADISVWPVTL
jgi:Holliday junction resolvase RusA-like endonuclease